MRDLQFGQVRGESMRGYHSKLQRKHFRSLTILCVTRAILIMSNVRLSSKFCKICKKIISAQFCTAFTSFAQNGTHFAIDKISELLNYAR